MKRIALSFDTSSQHLDYVKISELRREMATRLDNALKTFNAGRWAGGAYTKDTIEIFLNVNSPIKSEHAQLQSV